MNRVVPVVLALIIGAGLVEAWHATRMCNYTANWPEDGSVSGHELVYRGEASDGEGSSQVFLADQKTSATYRLQYGCR